MSWKIIQYIKINASFKKFVELLASKWAIVGSFAFLDTSQLLSKFESNFVFKSGWFGLVKVKEEVVDNLVAGFSVQVTGGKIANVTAEAVSWVRYFEWSEEKFWLIYFIVRNISSVTFAAITASASAITSSRASAVASASASLQ